MKIKDEKLISTLRDCVSLPLIGRGARGRMIREALSTAADRLEALTAALPHMGGVMGEVTYEIENEEGEFCAGSNSLADAQHYAMVYGQDHPVRLIEVTRRVISSPFALASHEPAPTVTQEGVSEAGKVLEYLQCGTCQGSGFSGHPDSGALCSECHGQGGIPLVRQSALTACQQEVERLNEASRGWWEQSGRWERRAKDAQARVAQLEEALEAVRANLIRLGWGEKSLMIEGIDAALGGQSNEA